MTITSWPAAERPREKLLNQGPQSLSDAELLAIFLRTGMRGKTAVDLARDLLTQFGSLRKLLNAKQTDFCQIPGLGQVKFTQLQACLELGKRYLKANLKQQDVIRDAADSFAYLAHQLRDREQEVFACLFLNGKNQVIAYEELFFGTINLSHVHPREVVKKALQHNAAGIIFSHNHPSGHVEPSQADIDVTATLKHTLDNIDVKVLDHIIIGDGRVFSFAQEGLF
tara:strand:- start:83285 stop:83959 length:675 start_codon:yes stop_codon:yes gene_type:complete